MGLTTINRGYRANGKGCHPRKQVKRGFREPGADSTAWRLTRRALCLIAGAVLLGSAANVNARHTALVGRWLTIDDDGKTPRSIVAIYERGGKLYGRVVEILDPAKRDGICDLCTDDRKDRPLLGLEIIRGLEPDGEAWSGGTIVDPKSGRIYRCEIRADDGFLDVRGYIGVSLFGRSQRWRRP